jgi:hypothetical protein
MKFSNIQRARSSVVEFRRALTKPVTWIQPWLRQSAAGYVLASFL